MDVEEHFPWARADAFAAAAALLGERIAAGGGSLRDAKRMAQALGGDMIDVARSPRRNPGQGR
jgi:hypothetical protein